MILDEEKLIFIHIPRTGGTSLEKCFIPTADQLNVPFKHQPASWYAAECPDRWRAYRKISIVRHPYDLILSRYAWSRRQAPAGTVRFPEIARLTFTEFVESLSDLEMQPVFKTLCQTDYLCDPAGRLYPEIEIMRHENLADAIWEKLKVRIPHIFKTAHPGREAYTPDLRETVTALFYKDFGNFGYLP